LDEQCNVGSGNPTDSLINVEVRNRSILQPEVEKYLREDLAKYERILPGMVRDEINGIPGCEYVKNKIAELRKLLGDK
jgi:hypothetical protein